MKKLLILATIASAIVGCKTIPSQQKVTTLSTAIGAASGAVCKMANVTSNEIEVITQVFDTMKEFIPEPSMTFSEKWTPIINAQVDLMYQDGKLTDDEVAIAKMVLVYSSDGVDYMFKKHPKWREYEDLVNTAINGFIKGFNYIISRKLTFSVTNEGDLMSNGIEIDTEAYNYFQSTYWKPRK